jgi:hypothetical protein
MYCEIEGAVEEMGVRCVCVEYVRVLFDGKGE